MWLQSGEANLKYPDPNWKDTEHNGRRALTQEVADEIVEEMDEDFLIERNRFPKDSGLGPELSRLPSSARVAFAQELYGIVMTRGEIRSAALAGGASLLPARSGRKPAMHTPNEGTGLDLRRIRGWQVHGASTASYLRIEHATAGH